MKNSINDKSLIEPPSAEEIRRVRVDSGLTQGQLAKMVGLSGGIAISKYEQGKRRPSAQIWTMILLMLNQHPTLHVARKHQTSDIDK